MDSPLAFGLQTDLMIATMLSNPSPAIEISLDAALEYHLLLENQGWTLNFGNARSWNAFLSFIQECGNVGK